MVRRPLRREIWLLLLLPLALGAVYLGARTPGLGDSSAVWERFDVETDPDKQMYLLMALALRGELDELPRVELDRRLDQLGQKQRRGFLFHFPQFAAAAK